MAPDEDAILEALVVVDGLAVLDDVEALPCGAFAFPRGRGGGAGGEAVVGWAWGWGGWGLDFSCRLATSDQVKDPGASMLPVPERTSTAPGARAMASKMSLTRRAFTMPLACALSSQ